LVQSYSAKTKIWAAGTTASPLARILAHATGAECDRSGRIKVKPDCSLPDHPEVFVVGDMMNFNDLPGVSEVALQSGLHAAHVIRKRVQTGAEPTAWKYRDLGSMAAVTRRSAIMSAHGVRLSGRIAWLVWLAVHITFMTGFKNRFTALIHWFLSFVGSGRCERAIAINLDRSFTHDLRRGGGTREAMPWRRVRDAASRIEVYEGHFRNRATISGEYQEQVGGDAPGPCNQEKLSAVCLFLSPSWHRDSMIGCARIQPPLTAELHLFLARIA
jgi:hypothetical protein